MQHVPVREDVRQIEQLELRQPERTELRGRRREHLHGTELQRFHLLAVLEQGAVRIDLDLDAPLGALLGELLEALGGLPLGRIARDDMAELDDDRLLREHARAREHEGQRKRKPVHQTFHGSFSL